MKQPTTLYRLPERGEARAGAQLAFSLVFSLGPQPMAWYCPQLGCVFPRELIQYRSSLTGMPKELSPRSILSD